MPECVQPACLTLTGVNFSLAACDNRILWNGNQLDVNWVCEGQGAGNCSAAIFGTVDRSGNRIKLSGIPIDAYRGIANIAVSLPDGSSSDPKTIAVSVISSSSYGPSCVCSRFSR